MTYRAVAAVVLLGMMVVVPLETADGLALKDRYPWLDENKPWTPICEPTPDQRYYLLEGRSPFQIDDKDGHCQGDRSMTTIKEELTNTLASEVTTQDNQIKVTLRDQVLFATGSADLSSAARDTLDKIAPILGEYPDEPVQVNGHTDNRPIGTADFANNDELSQARAQSVIDYFVSDQELSESRFEARGFGANRPLVPNDSPANRSKNRRVELLIGE